MAEILVRGGMLVTMDATLGEMAGDILVRDGTIAGIAPQIAAPPGAEIIDATGMIVMPGLVNAHLHTWQTSLRGLAADWTIAEYLRGMHAGLATFFRPDDIHISTLCGALNQIDCGTTMLVDWYHNNPTPAHTDANIAALDEAGIRTLFLHGSPKPDPKDGQKHFSEVPMPRAEVQRLRNGRFAADDGLVTMGLAILGPAFSVYDTCLADFRLAKDLDCVTSMHVSGPLLAQNGFHKLDDEGLLGPKLNIVHGNFLDDDTLKLLADRGLSFTVTAESEMQMSFGKPLTGRLRAHGLPVSIGTDVESDVSGDMFTAMRMTLQAQRLVDTIEAMERTGKGPETITVTCRDALRWATIDGARMAGMDARLGSLSPGKQADLVLLDAMGLNMVPVVDPVASIVLQAGPGNVDTVLIGGKIVKRAGRLCYEGLERRMGQLAASSQKIVGALHYAQSKKMQ